MHNEESRQEVLDRLVEGAIHTLNRNLGQGMREVYTEESLAYLKALLYQEAVLAVTQRFGKRKLQFRISAILEVSLLTRVKSGVVSETTLAEIKSACFEPIHEGITSFKVEVSHLRRSKFLNRVRSKAS
jgi:hypothetical protein